MRGKAHEPCFGPANPGQAGLGRWADRLGLGLEAGEEDAGEPVAGGGPPQGREAPAEPVALAGPVCGDWRGVKLSVNFSGGEKAQAASYNRRYDRYLGVGHARTVL